MKLLKYDDIPKYVGLIRSWGLDQSWHNIERFIDDLNTPDMPVELEPDFQRAHVWSPGQQVAWVEFCLRGGHQNSPIMFNEYPSGQIVLVDGLQRLTSIRKFRRGELRVLHGLYGKIDGWSYDEMDPSVKRVMRLSTRIEVNRLTTRESVLLWYIQLNSGVAHTKEELDRVRSLWEAERMKPI